MATRELIIQSTVTALENLEEVKLGKVVNFNEVESVEAALAAVGNDSEKLLKVINDGLAAETRRIAREDETGWHSYKEDGTLNGEYSGKIVDSEKIAQLVLTFAKMAGFGPDKTADQKREIKSKARDKVKRMLSNDPEMLASVALSASE